STTGFHEGLNLACVQKAPFVLIVENNKYAYSTPTSRQTANPRFVDRARAYGCLGESVDGNDVLAVYEVTRRAVARARRGLGPSQPDGGKGHAAHRRVGRSRRGVAGAVHRARLGAAQGEERSGRALTVEAATYTRKNCHTSTRPDVTPV